MYDAGYSIQVVSSDLDLRSLEQVALVLFYLNNV